MALPITLPIFTYTKEQSDELFDRSNLGLPEHEDSLLDSDISNLRVYIIENVGEHPFEGDGDFSLISSGGVMYICALSMAEVIKMIEE